MAEKANETYLMWVAGKEVEGGAEQSVSEASSLVAFGDASQLLSASQTLR